MEILRAPRPRRQRITLLGSQASLLSGPPPPWAGMMDGPAAGGGERARAPGWELAKYPGRSGPPRGAQPAAAVIANWAADGRSRSGRGGPGPQRPERAQMRLPGEAASQPAAGLTKARPSAEATPPLILDLGPRLRAPGGQGPWWACAEGAGRLHNPRGCAWGPTRGVLASLPPHSLSPRPLLRTPSRLP